MATTTQLPWRRFPCSFARSQGATPRTRRMLQPPLWLSSSWARTDRPSPLFVTMHHLHQFGKHAVSNPPTPVWRTRSFKPANPPARRNFWRTTRASRTRCAARMGGRPRGTRSRAAVAAAGPFPGAWAATALRRQPPTQFPTFSNPSCLDVALASVRLQAQAL